METIQGINNKIVKLLPRIKDKNYEVLFITGKNNYEELKQEQMPKNVILKPYIDNMNELLKVTDLIISRAGATTISEITSLAIPSILIPSPYVANNHQEINAEDLEKNNAACVIKEKDFDEDLGIVFESAVFDRIKPCTNHCIFCFVDQQPEGLRKSLYIKDDDYRLSYLQGTYVTLTNLTSKDRERIERLHLGPLYVSVHTTNPKLRQQMLNNPKAANILEDLKWLKKADIPIHAQIVLCPDYNDGKELENTLKDFEKFKSIIQSIAIVPVGITKFHKNNLSLLTKENALNVIKQVESFNKRVKKHLAMASDEFFLKADYPIPPKEYYGNFAQIEDGVGALRLLMDDFEETKKLLPAKIKKPKSITFATTPSAQKVISEIVEDLNKIQNLKCNVITLKNNWMKNF